MQFKTDENLPEDVAALLCHHGHDALSVNDQRLSGMEDAELIAICQVEARILVTLDTDFADIRTYPPREHEGIIVLRLIQQDKQHVLDVVSRLVPLLSNQEVAKQLWIVDERQVRIRS